MIYQPLFFLFDWARDVLPWIDLTIASMPLAEGTNLMGEPVDIGGTEWAQFSVATLIWVVLPLVLGAMRVRSSEVK